MNTNIRYNGLSAVPSDYEAPDGDLALSLNLIHEDGHLAPVVPPKSVLTLQENERLLFIHSVPGQRNYILARGDTSGSFGLYWLQAEDETEATDSAEFIGTYSGLRDITALGNTVVLALSGGMEYILWKDDDYRPLGKRPPFTSIDFGLYKVGTLTETGNYSIPSAALQGTTLGNYGGNSVVHPNIDESQQAEMTQMVYGLVNPAIAETVTSKGRFHQPFFVRYAFRLYDGSYSWHSAPILMLPTTIPPIVKCTLGTFTASGEGNAPVTFTLNIPYFALSYRILSQTLMPLADWSDIVSGIDIFITSPLYTYDQSKDIPGQRAITGTKAFAGAATPDRTIVEATGENNGGDNNHRHGSHETYPDNVFIGHYAESISGVYGDHFMDFSTGSADLYYVVNIQPNANFISSIPDAHEFYKIAEIDVKDIKAMTDMVPLNLTTTDLSGLVARPRLADDYRSHCRVVASSLYAFNSRLNLADIELYPAEPFPIRSIMQFGNPTSDETNPVTATATIKVWSRPNGVRCVATHTASSTNPADVWFDPDNNFPRYIFYPDASAYKMEITISATKKYILDLTPHSFLNGAYFFGKASLGVEPVPENATEEAGNCPTSVRMDSKIYTSEAGNPFVFPLLGINTIGSGRVFAICSAAKALSQGQFGQFPLYAFTTEGVWALETTATGSYSARQPITRDVCINPASITQIDSAVLFASDRGIMLLSGSQTQCISDTINTDDPFDVTELPHLSELHAEMIDDSETDSCIPTLPFTQFIAGCRMIYDYAHQRILLYNPSNTYAYIFSLKSKSWGMMHSDIVEGVPSYPNALAMQETDSGRKIVDFAIADSDAGVMPCMLVTRPLKLGEPDGLKTISTVIQRGFFCRGRVKSVLYGSRDLFSWHLVWTSGSHYMRGFSGTPFKYFRIALLCNIAARESVAGASISYQPRLSGKLR